MPKTVDSQRVRIQVIENVGELENLIPPWKALAQVAVDSNFFYEPWMLIPSLRYQEQNRKLLFLFVFIPDPDQANSPPLLCGMFPFERRTRYRALPGSVLRSLKPLYTELCTPLVRRGFERECVSAVLDWLAAASPGSSLVEFRFITGEGRVAQELHQQQMERQWMALQTECTTRALLKPMASAEAYLEKALRGRRRKELRRLENRLREKGPTEYRYLEPGGDADGWIQSFLDLEAKGWKGQAGTSLASQEATRRFFETAATEAYQQGQLRMVGLFHQDKPIALKCNFYSGNGSFAFKIAYDEQYAAYSPGLLLEVENIRRFHESSSASWMDSTAVAHHFMINRLWMDRRMVETLLLSPDRAWGNAIISTIPLLRWIKTAARKAFARKTKESNPDE